uniref:Lysosomal amino acid transporter 1 homolog n=1 Tax=Mesocestoides corti TaxID=53468 RepID=A0A5K3FVS4_MESCO
MSTTPAPGSLEAECPGGLDWAWYGLGECIRSTQDKVSIAFGVLSIVSWCFFGFPQIYENCVRKMPDSAVSAFLLVFWLLGDSLNFIGAFLTGQLFLQKLLAGYTVLIDIILCVQYLYYLILHKVQLKRHPKVEDLDEEEEDAKSSAGPARNKILATVLLGVIVLSVVPLPMSGESPVPRQTSVSGRRLLQATTTPDPWADFLATPGEKVGYVFGWMSTIMYAAGRIHQIFMNWRRKCTEGLSFYLFFLAVLGNTFYSCQIFTKSIDAVFIVNSLPWIIGSMGILLFDAFILIQFFIYRGNTEETFIEEDIENDGEKNDIQVAKF